MADRRVLRSSVILSSFLVLASYISNLNYLKEFGNAQTQTWESFSSMDAAYLVELQLNPLTNLKLAGGNLVIFRWKRFQKSCVAYYSNCTASFSPADVSLVRGGDIHPQPGPIRQCKESAKFDIPKALKANVKVAHLNVRSLKSRENFCLVKDTILHSGFVFILHRIWDGLCTYARSNLKITVLENLSSACDDGFQQLWLRVQCRKYKSFLICNTYRPPQTPTTCFESLANSLTDALLLDLNVVILGDLNCNLLAPDPETTSLQTFISTFNLHQLVKKL